jgi:hypothetical protein
VFHPLKHAVAAVTALLLAAGVAASCGPSPACGGAGEPCCNNAVCNGGFTCNAASFGTCEVSCVGGACPTSGTDAGSDGGVDVGPDAGFDAAPDAGTDAGFDAGFDAQPPPSEDGGSQDSTTPPEASLDSGPDARTD